MDTNKKKSKTGSDTGRSKKVNAVSWLSHPTRLFEQAERSKEKNGSLLTSGELNLNGAFGKKNSQSSTKLQEKLLTSDGHMLKEETNTEELGGTKSNKGNGNNIEVVHSKKANAVSWLSHPTKLFEQAERSEEKNGSLLTSGESNLNWAHDKKKTPSSTELQEKLLTSDGHMLRDETNTVELGGTKSNEGTGNNIEGNNIEVIHNNITESNGFTTNGKTGIEEATKKFESNCYEQTCLDLIEMLAAKLRTEDIAFCKIIERILNFGNAEDSEVIALRYKSTETLLGNLLDSNLQDLKSVEPIIKAMILPDSLKKIVVSNDSLREDIFCVFGQGRFSVMHEGILSKDGREKRIALKRPRAKIFESVIMNEAKVLSECDHENIIKILALKRTGPEIAIELMELGSLEETMQTVHFSDKNILKILKDIASAMEYLHGKKYLHRGLESDNIFINAKKQCKIGSFGSSVYVGDSNGLYEDKDMTSNAYILSPETYCSKIFRYQTDVWSMGLLIWDIYQLSSSSIFKIPPFIKLLLFQDFRDGKKIWKKPDRCPHNLFTFVSNHLMDRNFKSRPDFIAIRKKLESDLASA